MDLLVFTPEREIFASQKQEHTSLQEFISSPPPVSLKN